MPQDLERSIIAMIGKAGDIDVETISRDTELAELEIDSLVLTELVMDLEDQNDIEIDLNTAEAWEALKTVGDIIGVVEKLVAEKNG